MDSNESERANCKTMDLGYLKIENDTKIVNLIDTPALPIMDDHLSTLTLADVGMLVLSMT
jgi:translation elongation factor EF-1alpha